MENGRAERLEVRGVGLNTLRGGEGPPLIYLHGAGGGGMWWPFLEALAGEFDVYAIEHPGFGQSDDPEWIETIHDIAYLYLDLLAQLGQGPVHLIGESLGGWISAEMAVRSTRDIASLALVGPAGLVSQEHPTSDIFIWDLEQTAENLFLDSQLRQGFLAAAGDMDQLEVNLKNRATTAKLAWNPRFHNPHLHKWLHRIAVPTLVVWGEQDRVIPVQVAEEWLPRLPQARRAVIGESSHLPHVEQPQAFLDAVMPFFREVQS